MFKKIMLWYLRRKAIRNTAKSFRYMLEVNKIYEEFAKHQILNAKGPGEQQEFRKILLSHKNAVTSHEAMLAFLRSLKKKK